MTGIAEFDPTQPLPEGLTVLEASAGTGKTYAVASIVVAEVADGRPIDEILVVTFTRKATGTLRERVWQRLSAAATALDPAEDDDTDAHDALIQHLRRGTPAEVAERRERLRRALAAFDTATIATIHGFCQQVLAGLGTAGDAERDAAVVSDVDDLVADAVDDLFVRRSHVGDDLLFDRTAGRAIARKVVANPDAAIAPVNDASPLDRLRRRFAVTLRERIRAQKRQRRLLTYDDLLARLWLSVDPERGTVAVDRLRRRFTLAVVDEFQDTDTVQWDIFRVAFAAAPSRLVLVGDPKQAIYAFRGGDVRAYLRATADADTEVALSTSWRSDQPLLDGLDAFFDGAELGDRDITHRALRARPGAQEPGLVGPVVGAPFTVRLVDRDHGHVETNRNGTVAVKSARAFIAQDLAGEAVRMLDARTEVVERDATGVITERRALRPGDIAVLVRRRIDAEQIRAVLHAAGVKAVFHGGGGVLTTEAARAWLELLRAVDAPSFPARVRAVAHGPFLEWDAARLAYATDDDWDHLDECLRDWGVALRAHGVMGLLRAVERSQPFTARLLRTEGGDRLLSDLRHVAELLHAEHAARRGTVATLAAWLAEELDRTETDGSAAESRRRLESDADAVTILTIHAAKGLEFPIVLLPSLWAAPWTAPDDPPVFHDDAARRSIGVGTTGAIHRDQKARARRERDEEDLRLLYVALTRAAHRVVIWWVTTTDARRSPFARVLLERPPGSPAVAAELDRLPSEADIRTALLARPAPPGAIAVEDATGSGKRRAVSPVTPTADLAVAAFDRTLDRTWKRTSYSALTAAAHDAPSPTPLLDVVDTDDIDGVGTVDEDDERDRDGAGATAGTAPSPVVPLSGVPGGTRVGTLVHEVLETLDFAATDLDAAVARHLTDQGADRLVPGRVDQLATGLAAAIRTPLGPTFGDRSLATIERGDRLNELAFDLPLAGGDRPVAAVTMAAIADVFAHGLAADDPLAQYHERLRDPALATSVRGFLNGSIDLVTRIDGRHIVIDYKTNLLGARGEPLTEWHYRPAALATAMADAHYPLQAALYSVALHRYLRWRLPAYDPATALGGVAYLFLRGMTGPDVAVVDGRPCGVFAWHPPARFVTALSDVLDRGAP